MNLALHSVAHLIALRLIQSLVEGTLIGLFAAAILRVSRQSAGTRFAVWFSSLMAIAALPILGGRWLLHVSSTPGTPAAVVLPDSWAFYLLGLWAMVAGWFLLGIAKGLLHLRALRNSCVELDVTQLDPLVGETLRRQQGTRRVALCTSDKVRVPTAIGLFRPAVLMPEWVMKELSADELNQVLLHELAHLRRWDDWTNLAQQFVKAVFCLHPVVWWIEKKAALEREIACDDAVLEETARPRAYAECLAHLAERSFVQRSVALAQAALGKIRQTTLRVTQILDPNRPPFQSRAVKPAVSLVAVFALACGGWAARTSRLIAFEDASSVQVSASTAPAFSPAFKDSNATAKIIPAVARSSQQVEITRAKLNLRAVRSKPSVPGRSRDRRYLQRKARPEQLVKLTSTATTAVPVTQTLFLVIENRAADPAGGSTYQIQMWHVTVLRSVIDPAVTQVPRKQI
jgi:beta-lactamase regulating signal transducer with metallopeptidase domain